MVNQMIEPLTITPRLSVVIPLYNKRESIARTLQSVLAQELPVHEVVVVDDGSTDGSGEVVEQLGSPLVRLIRQANAGVSVARNRGVEEATGDFIALLDADDRWESGYTAEVVRLILSYPGCGLYCVGFDVDRPEGRIPNQTGVAEGVVTDYFTRSMRHTLTHTSSTTIPRSVFLGSGGFPAGMKLGEDQYLWVKIARDYAVAYSPARLSIYNLQAENRSTQRYRIEQTPFSMREFYDPTNPSLNEYIARCEIGKATLHTTFGYTAEARSAERFYAYTRTYRYGWWKLWTLNRLPASWRAPLMRIYKRLAWLVSRKGLFEL